MEQPFVKKYHFTTKKGGKAVKIGQLTDIHIGLANDEDLKDPEIAETVQYRKWLKDGKSLPWFKNVLEYCRDFDTVVLTGDVLDYYTTAGRDALCEALKPYNNVMAAVGGHDLTLQMETPDKNKRPLNERCDLLREFWCNDIQFASRVLEDKVTVVVMNNNTQLWKEWHDMFDKDQFDKLSACIDDARKNGRIVLLFFHEPIVDGYGNKDYIDEKSGKQCTYIATPPKSEWEKKTYELITNSADVIKGIFCGHLHYADERSIAAGYTENGKFVKCDIPIVVTYWLGQNENGYLAEITVE